MQAEKGEDRVAAALETVAELTVASDTAVEEKFRYLSDRYNSSIEHHKAEHGTGTHQPPIW